MVCCSFQICHNAKHSNETLPRKKRVNYLYDNIILKIVSKRKLNYMYKYESECGGTM